MLILESVHFWYKINLSILNIFAVSSKNQRRKLLVFLNHPECLIFLSVEKKCTTVIQRTEPEVLCFNIVRQWRNHKAMLNDFPDLNGMLYFPGYILLPKSPCFNIPALLKALGWCEFKSNPASAGFHSAGKTDMKQPLAMGFAYMGSSPSHCCHSGDLFSYLRQQGTWQHTMKEKKMCSEFWLAGMQATEAAWILQQEANCDCGGSFFQQKQPT